MMANPYHRLCYQKDGTAMQIIKKMGLLFCCYLIVASSHYGMSLPNEETVYTTFYSE